MNRWFALFREVASWFRSRTRDSMRLIYASLLSQVPKATSPWERWSKLDVGPDRSRFPVGDGEGSALTALVLPRATDVIFYQLMRETTDENKPRCNPCSAFSQPVPLVRRLLRPQWCKLAVVPMIWIIIREAQFVVSVLIANKNRAEK